MPKDLHVKLSHSADATSKSMNAEIIARLEGSFSAALGASDEIVALLARLQHELAEAKYREHLHVVERSELVRDVQDFVWGAENEDLTDRLEDIHGFETMRKLAEGDVYAQSYLEELARDRETELSRTKNAMEEALSRLRNQELRFGAIGKGDERPAKK
ncbi:hypothetical protein BAU06_09225 [Bordetella bronchialis]|uniref:Arc-like DNA binding domain-containing protein n=2 Tax=Bordetella bronchialis TaxID=463025 RepID=A0ABN4R5B2_9BORD|nr:hypothetical protein BAU06_09225 [Bordetella bronchialis]